MSVDLSGEITAIATAVLAGFAIVTATLAALAFRKQSQEVRILQQQMHEDALARRRQQASRVIFSDARRTEPGKDGATLHITHTVMNGSDLPIYNLSQYFLPGTEDIPVSPSIEGTAVLGPGKEWETERRLQWTDYATVEGADIYAVAVAVIFFQDASGVAWKRERDGTLTEVSDPYIYDGSGTFPMRRAQDPLRPAAIGRAAAAATPPPGQASAARTGEAATAPAGSLVRQQHARRREPPRHPPPPSGFLGPCHA